MGPVLALVVVFACPCAGVGPVLALRGSFSGPAGRPGFLFFLFFQLISQDTLWVFPWTSVGRISLRQSWRVWIDSPVSAILECVADPHWKFLPSVTLWLESASHSCQSPGAWQSDVQTVSVLGSTRVPLSFVRTPPPHHGYDFLYFWALLDRFQKRAAYF